MILFRSLAVPHLVLALAACSDAAGGPRAERADSAGVEIVRNPAADRPLALTFTPALSLGGADEGPESFYQVSNGAVGTDGAGNLYVLDRGNHRVLVFDPQGNHLRTLGRKGGGPGEFGFPSVMAVAQDGGVGVFDFSKHGVVRFAPDGSVGETIHFDRTLGGGYMAFTPDGLLIRTRELDQERGLDVSRLILRRGEDSTPLAVLEQPLGKPVEYRNCPVRISSMSPLLAPALEWAARGSTVAVNRGPEYRIDVHEGGRVARSVRRDLPPVPATPEIAAALVPNGEMHIRFGSGECRIPAADVVEAQGFAPLVPAVDDLALAPDGTLWVRRTAPGEVDPPIDLFDATGEYLGTLPAGTPFPAAFTPQGDVVAVEKDELDLEHVVVYRVGRG